MGYCGYKCEFCPAHRATKQQDDEALAVCAEVWHRILGWEFTKDGLKCSGCYNELGQKVRKECAVRSCCRSRGYVTCGECPDYPCEELRARFVSRQMIEEKLGEALDPEIYQIYVKPLENKERLDTIHKRYGK